MADSGGSYRGGGRRGNYRADPYSNNHISNTLKDTGRERGGGGGGGGGGGDRSERERSRHQDRRDRKPEPDRRERHRSDDRDKVHKPRHNRSPPRKSGLGYSTSIPNRPSSSSGKTSGIPPTGPKAHFEPATREEKPKVSKATKEEEEEDVEMEGLDEEEREARMIKKFLGFTKFKSTKNTKIPGNEFNYAVRKEKETKYRQYMNRTGGFNRPLSPPR